MSDTDETKRPKTLSLKKTEMSTVKQSFSHGRTKAVVVEKKRTLGSGPAPAKAPVEKPVVAEKPVAAAPAPVAKPATRPEPQRLLETTWPDGRTMYVASNGTVNFMLTAANAGEMPYFEKGVNTRLVPDDGSAKWRDLVEKSSKKPYFRK